MRWTWVRHNPVRYWLQRDSLITVSESALPAPPEGEGLVTTSEQRTEPMTTNDKLGRVWTLLQEAEAELAAEREAKQRLIETVRREGWRIRQVDVVEILRDACDEAEAQ